MYMVLSSYVHSVFLCDFSLISIQNLDVLKLLCWPTTHNLWYQYRHSVANELVH